jgi:solute carrier family 25, member 38
MISEKGLYGMVSGVITTALLQPFENIKMALMLPPRELKPLHLRSSVLQNTQSSCAYIFRADGLKGFYKGMVAATLKAALGCYIYFSGLRALERPNMTAWQNFWVSSLSLIISFLTNPLSIVETRFELAYFHGYTSVHAAVLDIYRKEGLKGFFSGGLSSCIKEGTFGGFHYMFYEELKAIGLHKLTSGIISGVIATSFTHPFEIIRARLQTQGLTEKHEFK